MATIKEVAKLANVSLGTVSNVLNGKTQNEDLIQRVEEAMTKLAYRPDASARSLKNTKTHMVGLILPDVFQKHYEDFLMEMERRLQSKGYHLLVKFSHNNYQIEKKAIESFLELRVEGLLLYSSTMYGHDNRMLKAGNIPVVSIGYRQEPILGEDHIVLECNGALRKLLLQLKKEPEVKVGVIAEQEALEYGNIREIYREIFREEDLIKIVDGSIERSFQAAFELCTQSSKITAILAGSRNSGEGIRKALDILKLPQIPVYVIKESRWLEDVGYYEGEITLSQKQVGREAMNCLMDAIESPQLHENRTRYVKAQLEHTNSKQGKIVKQTNPLRFAMYDCSSARSLEMLSAIYERESGEKVQFDRYPYRQLEQLLYQKGEEKDSAYDGFMLDITWFEGMVEDGWVENLDHLLTEKKSFLKGFAGNALKDYGMYVESLYAIPFMPGAQILFYQKDLFDNPSLQNKFRRKYHSELCPPKTWAEFNAVAEFFSRKFTPSSPVKYGLSMSMGEDVYLSIEFLDRLWSYGGAMFDSTGKVSIHSENGHNAMKSLLQSYQYSSGKMLNSWNQVAEEFAQGDSAMVLLYNSDVGEINNYTRSKVSGNIGYSLIPGGTSVMGGWSLALNRYGIHKEEAERFLLWACGNQNSIPLSLLGGTSLRKNYYESSDLENQEPWKNLIQKVNDRSRKRPMPEIPDESRWKNRIYTEIIPEEIMKVVKGKSTEEEALLHMEERIGALLKR